MYFGKGVSTDFSGLGSPIGLFAGGVVKSKGVKRLGGRGMLYFVTDRRLAGKEFYRVIQEAVAGGVDAIILREKDLEKEALVSVAKKIKSIVKGSNTELIVNGDLSVAKAVKAHGYHVGFEQFCREERENYKGFNGKIGVSVHSLKEAKLALQNGADYLLAGHIFETSCKEGLEPRGISWLKEIIEGVDIPVIAIGGIHEKNLDRLQSIGLHGIAVRSLIMESREPHSTVRKLRNQWLID